MSEDTETHFTMLRRCGARITPVVRAVVNHLHAVASVRSPQALKAEISAALGCEIGFPTIYRVLDRLMCSGLVCLMHRSDNQTCYYLCRTPGAHHHHHFICTACGSVQEVDVCIDKEFSRYVEQHLGARMTGHIVQLEGVCAQCN